MVLLSVGKVHSAPVTEGIIERQTTAIEKLEAVAIIEEYHFQTWCSEWLLNSYGKKIRYGRLGLKCSLLDELKD